jgi:hypothetical protein
MIGALISGNTRVKKFLVGEEIRQLAEEHFHDEEMGNMRRMGMMVDGWSPISPMVPSGLIV